MGNKQTKSETPTSPVEKGGPPPKVSPTDETHGKAESSLSSENSPSLPAYDPDKDEALRPELTSGRNRGMDIALLTQLKQEREEEAKHEESEAPAVPPANTSDVSSKEPVETETKQQEMADEVKQEETETPPVPSAKDSEDLEKKMDQDEEGPSENQTLEEEVPDATPVIEETSRKVEMPPLALDKIDQMPPVANTEEKEDDDTDLMAPPVVLTDAMSPLKDTEIRPVTESSSHRSGDLSNAVLLASPITHDEVSLVEPVPVTTPVAEPPERDSISIEDEVSAVDAESVSKPDDVAELAPSTLEFRALNDVPEDTISLTSSVARGEDELFKNIMGHNRTFPAETSDESIRGTNAISEMTFDESAWDTTQRIDLTTQTSMEVPLMLHVFFDMMEDASIAVRFDCEEKVEEIIDHPDEDMARTVASVVDTIFANVILKAEKEEAKEKELALSAEPEPKIHATEETPIADVIPEKPADKEPALSVEVTPAHVSPYQMTEKRIVNVVIEEVSGAVKVSLNCQGEEDLSLEKFPSRVSDNQSSLVLKTPFIDMSESQDLTGMLDHALEQKTEKVTTVEKEATEKLEEEEESIEEPAMPKTANLDAETEQTSTATPTPNEPEPAREGTLSPSASGDGKKLKKTKSRQKKSGSGEVTSKQSPGLRTSLSDGTASVDSSTAPASKPKPQPGRSTRGRSRGRGRGRTKRSSS